MFVHCKTADKLKKSQKYGRLNNSRQCNVWSRYVICLNDRYRGHRTFSPIKKSANGRFRFLRGNR